MNNLEKIIKSKGYTKSFVCSKLGLTLPRLQRYSEGRTSPSIKKAYEIAKFLDCTVEDIFFAKTINHFEK